MRIQRIIVAGMAGFLIFTSGSAALAGKTIEEVGAFACVTDKWDEKELEKDHKIADAVFRCVGVPDDTAAPKYTEDCIAKYEYMPDKSWKSKGTCTRNYKGGDQVFDSFEEGSHLKDYTYTTTGGTGKYQGATGTGTYLYENITDSLGGSRFKGKLILP